MAPFGNMFCCFGGSYGADDSLRASAVSNRSALSHYPGQRRFVPTEGNALSAAPASPCEAPTRNDNNNAANELVSVTVPPGVSPGQMIQVTAPDGSGRVISAVAPKGMALGSTFMVEFPPGASGAVGAMPVTAPAPPAAPQQSPIVAVAAVSPQGAPQQQQPIPAVLAEPEHSLPSPIPPPPAPPTSRPQQSQQSIMRVQVPPGTSPGSTLYVQVPGEDRTIAAVVPPGVSEFHVAYEPSSSVPATATPVPAATPLPLPAPSGPVAPPGQSLMLVKVPPGTAPGSTLHVQVPGENRIIAATVPPGGVSEFHVSYAPSSSPHTSINNASEQGPPSFALPAQQNGNIGEEALLLVRVPPGTAPGSTLHVQVPGEDGRVIAAQVPPGVTEFHVSYRKSPANGNASTTQPHQQQMQEQGYHNDSGFSQNNNDNNRPNGISGSAVPLVAGGALMGAVGMAMATATVGHYHNNGHCNESSEANGAEYESDVHGVREGEYGGGGDCNNDFDDGGGDFDGGDFN